MIEEAEWASIRAMIEQVTADISGTRREFFVTGKVIKRDKTKNLIWMEEFGIQPIPLFTFDYEVKYYDESPKGTTAVGAGTNNPHKVVQKIVKAKVICPQVGDTVLVAREMGVRRLPRCLGVLRSRDFIISTED